MKYLRDFFLTFLFFLGAQVPLKAQGAKILGIFHPPAPSHYFLGSKLLKELARKGHEVTMVSPFENKEKIPNWKDVLLTGIRLEETMKNRMISMPEENVLTKILNTFNMVPMLAEAALNHTNVLKLLKSKEKFDLVIMEGFMNEAHLGFAHHYDCPVVILSTIGSNLWVNLYNRNPAPSSYVVEVLVGYAGKMTFFQRMKNGLIGTFMGLHSEFVNIPYQDKMLHKYFPNAPYIKELFQKVSMILLNSHISVSSPKPHLPNMIEIGGFHISDVKELPKDLKQYLDSCKEGFILFSMGSNIKSTFFRPEVKEVFLKVFSELPYKVLWKYEEDLPRKPNNVRIDNWLPQNDVLAHPNLKLFITHGGLLSTTEAIYHGVPIVGIPVFGDQKMNMAMAEIIQIGKALNFRKLEVNTTLSTIKEVIDTPKFRDNAKRRSAIMKDRPQKPIDEAIFWVEHVLRHKGGDHFKTSALELNYFELYQLDVTVFLLSLLLLVLYIPYKICQFCYCRRKDNQYKSQKKTQ